MDWENLIEDSVIEFLEEQLKGSEVKLEDLTLQLGTVEGQNGTNEFFMKELKAVKLAAGTKTYDHPSGVKFVIYKKDVKLFKNLALRTAKVATKEGVHTVVTFVPRMGVDFNSESDKLEE